MTWLPLFFGSHARQKISLNLWRSQRENGKRTGHHWSIQVSQRQKGRNMTPTIVGFCPWLTSVMVLYGLTVTMRIHQLLTIRKISNYLNHLLMFSSCVCALERHQKLEFRGCNHTPRIWCICFLVNRATPAFFNWSGQLSERKSLCWVNPLLMIPDNHPKWP